MKIATSKKRIMPIGDIIPADYNPRQISGAALQGLGHSIKRFGYVQPLVWNERSDRLVGGHQRLKVLLSQGVEEVEVVVVDLSPAEEKALNIAMNNPHISGEFTEAVIEILHDLDRELPKAMSELRMLPLLDAPGELKPERIAGGGGGKENGGSKWGASEQGMTSCKLGEYEINISDELYEELVAYMQDKYNTEDQTYQAAFSGVLRAGLDSLL